MEAKGIVLARFAIPPGGEGFGLAAGGAKGFVESGNVNADSVGSLVWCDASYLCARRWYSFGPHIIQDIAVWA